MNLKEREKVLKEALAKNRKVVLYLVEDTKSAQFRYRCKNVVEAVEQSDVWAVVWFLKEEINVVEKYLGRISLVVIERQTDKDGGMRAFIKKAHEEGVKALLDLDDLIFDYRDLPLLMRSTNSKNVFYWAGYFWGIRRIASVVDGFLCTNDFLGKKLYGSYKKPYKVIPNSLNREQVEVSEKLIADGCKKHEEFLVGYFSGSPTHVKDFAMMESELIKFMKIHNDVKMKVVGYMEFSKAMEKWLEEGRVEMVPLVDYLELQRLIGEVDVNIAPLRVNDFTNCKSELKFFEAAIVETTTIASPTYVFEKAIVDGENGFLARDGEWYDKLDYLYRHPKENQKMALMAKKYALKHYYGKNFLKEVEEAYEYFAQ